MKILGYEVRLVPGEEDLSVLIIEVEVKGPGPRVPFDEIKKEFLIIHPHKNINWYDRGPYAGSTDWWYLGEMTEETR
jgi:hypothetical protein